LRCGHPQQGREGGTNVERLLLVHCVPAIAVAPVGDCADNRSGRAFPL
jgi:hypothetical protein